MSVRVTILTDFGTRDGYVAAMKGVIAELAPDALLDDASHEHEQGDVWSAAWALARYWRLFPEGSVHLVVVDPGVGTRRRALALEVDGRFVVAPDNGVVTRVLESAGTWRAVEIRRVEAPVSTPSDTFHGRDVFAPAAGRLAAGDALEDLGPSLDDPVRLHFPRPRREEEGGVGQVVTVDHFGNLISNIPGEWVRKGSTLEVGGRRLSFVRSYALAEPESLTAVINSEGLVEVGERDGSAMKTLGAARGWPVRLLPPGRTEG